MPRRAPDGEEEEAEEEIAEVLQELQKGEEDEVGEEVRGSGCVGVAASKISGRETIIVSCRGRRYEYRTRLKVEASAGPCGASAVLSWAADTARACRG